MGEGIYEQMKNSNVIKYGNLTQEKLNEVIEEVFGYPKRKVLLDTLDKSKFTLEQKVNLKYLINSGLEDDFNIAKEIIKINKI